jgi:leader peptidase (prepilin peptidase)/N-methyltransferase
VWELAALAWLILVAVPLAFTGMAVRRLPDPLAATAFTGTLVLLTAAALAGHQPAHLARAAIFASALACFYLLLWLIRAGEMGLGTRRSLPVSALCSAGSTGRRLSSAPFAGFAMAAVYGGVLLTVHGATRTSHLPLGPLSFLARSRLSPSDDDDEDGGACRFLRPAFLPCWPSPTRARLRELAA